MKQIHKLSCDIDRAWRAFYDLRTEVRATPKGSVPKGWGKRMTEIEDGLMAAYSQYAQALIDSGDMDKNG